MTKFKALLDRVTMFDANSFLVSFLTTDKVAIAELQEIDSAVFQKVEVKKYSERRSLNANAYFHVLIGEIAKATTLPASEVKKQMVYDYGTQLGVFRVETTVPLELAFTYYKIISESKGTKRPCVDVTVWKPTHTLDRAEMARLIDGVVNEAKALGIKTETPNDIANMINLWEQENEL